MPASQRHPVPGDGGGLFPATLAPRGTGTGAPGWGQSPRDHRPRKERAPATLARPLPLRLAGLHAPPRRVRLGTSQPARVWFPDGFCFVSEVFSQKRTLQISRRVAPAAAGRIWFLPRGASPGGPRRYLHLLSRLATLRPSWAHLASAAPSSSGPAAVVGGGFRQRTRQQIPGLCGRHRVPHSCCHREKVATDSTERARVTASPKSFIHRH